MKKSISLLLSLVLTLSLVSTVMASADPITYTTKSLPEVQGYAQVESYSDGKVFVYSGHFYIYDPDQDTYTETSVPTDFIGYTDFSIVRLNDGRIWLSGGFNGSTVSNKTKYYDRSTDTWSNGPNLPVNLYSHRTSLLKDGRVIIVGGRQTTGSTAVNTRIFDPSNNTFTSVASMPYAIHAHAQTVMNDGRVFVAGGITNMTLSSVTNRSYIYDPAANTWTPISNMTGRRAYTTAVTLLDGTVLVIGGMDQTNSQPPTVYSYNPKDNSWATLTNLPVGMFHVDATLLPNWKVFVLNPPVGASYIMQYTEDAERNFSQSIVGGELIFEFDAISFPDIILDSDSVVKSTSSTQVRLIDNTGSADGWVILMSGGKFSTNWITDPSSQGSSQIITSIPSTAISVNVGTINTIAGQPVHNSYGPLTSNITLSSSPQTIVSAEKGFGMGMYGIPIILDLTVPKTVSVDNKSGTGGKYNIGSQIGTIAEKYYGRVVYTVAAKL